MTAHEVAAVVGPGRVLEVGEPRRRRESRGVEHRLGVECETEPGPARPILSFERANDAAISKSTNVAVMVFMA